MDLDELGLGVLARLEAKNARREEVLNLSRHLGQYAARAIRAIHRGEWRTVDELLSAGNALLVTMNTATEAYPDLAAAGYTLDAQKEHAEAHLLRALLEEQPLPAPGNLGVDDAAWLNGLGEAAGELRRAALDLIRRGEVEVAERVLGQMQDIYLFLSTVDFPSAVTRDLRRTNDMVRGVTERTRGDLTMVMRQEQLKAALDRFEARMAPPAAD